MSLFKRLHLQGSISKITSETSDDGGTYYNVRVAVKREDRRRAFINLKCYASSNYDPWQDLRRGMDCRFDCEVRGSMASDGTVENELVCLYVEPLPTLKTEALLREVLDAAEQED